MTGLSPMAAAVGGLAGELVALLGTTEQQQQHDEEDAQQDEPAARRGRKRKARSSSVPGEDREEEQPSSLLSLSSASSGGVFSSSSSSKSLVVCSGSHVGLVDVAEGRIVAEVSLEGSTTSDARCCATDGIVVVARGEWFETVARPCVKWRTPERIVCVETWGSWCFGGGASGKAHAWEVWTGRLARCWDAHYKSTRRIKACEHELATGGDDGLVRLWLLADLVDDSLETVSPRRTLDAHASAVKGLCWTGGPHGRLCSCSVDGTLKLWDKGDNNNNKPVFSTSFAASLSSAAVDADESRIAVGAESGAIFAVNLDASAIWAAKEAAAGGSFYSVFDDGCGGGRQTNSFEDALLLDKRAPQQFEPRHRSAVTALTFVEDDDDDDLVSASLDGSVKIWRRGALRVALTLSQSPPLTDMLLLRTPLVQKMDAAFPRFFQRRRHQPTTTTAGDEHSGGDPTHLLHLVNDDDEESNCLSPCFAPAASFREKKGQQVPELKAQLEALIEENDRWRKACDSLWHAAVVDCSSPAE